MYTPSIYQKAVKDPASIELLVHDDGVVVPGARQDLHERAWRTTRTTSTPRARSPRTPTASASACSSATSRGRATTRSAGVPPRTADERIALLDAELDICRLTTAVRPRASTRWRRRIAEVPRAPSAPLAQAEAFLAGSRPAPRARRARAASSWARSPPAGSTRRASPRCSPAVRRSTPRRSRALDRAVDDAARARARRRCGVRRRRPAGRPAAAPRSASALAETRARVRRGDARPSWCAAGAIMPAEHDRLLDRAASSAPGARRSAGWRRRSSCRSTAPTSTPARCATSLDGREKIVLVVRGTVAPAPLARCITPGTLVLQTADGTGLDRVRRLRRTGGRGAGARGSRVLRARSRPPAASRGSASTICAPAGDAAAARASAARAPGRWREDAAQLDASAEHAVHAAGERRSSARARRGRRRRRGPARGLAARRQSGLAEARVTRDDPRTRSVDPRRRRAGLRRVHRARQPEAPGLGGPAHRRRRVDAARRQLRRLRLPGLPGFAEQAVDGRGAAGGSATWSTTTAHEAIAGYLGVDAGAGEQARGAAALRRRQRRRDAAGRVSRPARPARAAAAVAGGGKGCAWGCLGLGRLRASSARSARSR